MCFVSIIVWGREREEKDASLRLWFCAICQETTEQHKPFPPPPLPLHLLFPTFSKCSSIQLQQINPRPHQPDHSRQIILIFTLMQNPPLDTVTLLEMVSTHRVPLLWNNCDHVTELGVSLIHVKNMWVCVTTLTWPDTQVVCKFQGGTNNCSHRTSFATHFCCSALWSIEAIVSVVYKNSDLQSISPCMWSPDILIGVLMFGNMSIS